jgi:hypothetical protein
MVKSEATATETVACPRAAVLDAWSDTEWNDGIQIDQMEELTTLAVRTTNSLYEITVLDGRTGDVLVRGGAFPRAHHCPIRRQHLRRLDSQEAGHLRGSADGD